MKNKNNNLFYKFYERFRIDPSTEGGEYIDYMLTLTVAYDKVDTIDNLVVYASRWYDKDIQTVWDAVRKTFDSSILQSFSMNEAIKILQKELLHELKK